MRMRSRAIGVDNKVGYERLVFLDIDRKELPDLKPLLKDLHNVMVLETRKGYHVLSLTTLPKRRWLNMLHNYSDYVDPEFIEHAEKYDVSILRISAKYSMKDSKPCSPPPKLIAFYENGRRYEAAWGHLLLYKTLHNINPKYAIPNYDSTVNLHFYYSGGD